MARRNGPFLISLGETFSTPSKRASGNAKPTTNSANSGAALFWTMPKWAANIPRATTNTTGSNADKMVCVTFRSSYRGPRVEGRKPPSVLIMVCRLCDLASEHGQADHGVEQHEREHEQTCSPEHESKARVRGSRLFDRDRERDNVGPERDCQRAEGRYENDSDHGEGQCVVTAMNAGAKRDSGQRADDRKDEQ